MQFTHNKSIYNRNLFLMKFLLIFVIVSFYYEINFQIHVFVGV